MADNQTQNRGVLADVTEYLSGIFRHMLPGILVVGGTNIAYPEWFVRLDLRSWQHVIVLGIVTIAVGNTWFALNRYGLLQFIDYILYLFKGKGPARKSKCFAFLDDVGEYTNKSLRADESSKRAVQHVAFRASAVLLILTVAELALLFGFFHAGASPFEGMKWQMIGAGLIALIVAIWQTIITRHIDYYVVNH